MTRKIQPGRVLWTRDSRRRGNAIVVGPTDREDTWLCETDFGNQMRLLSSEIKQLYRAGPVTSVKRWYRDRDELRRRP